MFVMALHLCLHFWESITSFSLFRLDSVEKYFHLKVTVRMPAESLIPRKEQQHSLHAAPSTEINVSKDCRHHHWQRLWLVVLCVAMSARVVRVLELEAAGTLLISFVWPMGGSFKWGTPSCHCFWHTGIQGQQWSMGLGIRHTQNYSRPGSWGTSAIAMALTLVHEMQPYIDLLYNRGLDLWGSSQWLVAGRWGNETAAWALGWQDTEVT